MFNKNFYPTPSNLAGKMQAKLQIPAHTQYTLLEPSAGKGDLCIFYNRNVFMHVCEIEHELQAILRDKKCKVVADDFLSYYPSYRYDGIIMNPPFNQGAAHFLHAWAIADGATIVCLLNAETIRNPYTAEREQVAGIIAEFGGEVEYIKDAFVEAERHTRVECALITIRKPASERATFGFEALSAMQVDGGDEPTQKCTDLASPNFVKNSVTAFNKMQAALKDAFDAVARVKYHGAGCGIKFNGNINYGRSDWEADLFSEVIAGSKAAYNNAVEQLTLKAWQDIFYHPQYQKLLTNAVKEGFLAEQKKRGAMAFTEANIYSFLEMILQGRGNAMEITLMQVFDDLTEYSEKNKRLDARWKTNSHYKVNKKCILPALAKYEVRSWGSHWSSVYNSGKWDWGAKLDDLDRVLCWITGKPFEGIKTIGRAVGEFINGKHNSDEPLESEFFTIKVYMKGTMHIVFKDETTWALFNRAAARGKNWIG